MSTSTEEDAPTAEAPYGRKKDGTPRKTAPPGWKQRFGEVETRKVDPSEVKRAKPLSTPSGLRGATVQQRLTEEDRKAFARWEPSAYDYAQLIAEGYDPDHSIHFAHASEEDIEAAYRLIKKLEL